MQNGIPTEINSIETQIREKNFEQAAVECFNVIMQGNDDYMVVALQKLLQIINTSNFELNREQLELIKGYIDYYDDQIMSLAIRVYQSTISVNRQFYYDEINFALEQLDEFEGLIRDHFIDFFISTFPWPERFAEKILAKLVARLNDDLWQHRLKVIDFLNEKLDALKPYLKEFDEKLLVTLQERDLDIIYETQEFLYRYILLNYTREDFQALIEKVYTSDWYTQEKILWLVGKIGAVKPELITDSKKAIIKFLDHYDGLVQKKASETIMEVMDAHVTFFDDIIIELLITDQLENLMEAESILVSSIVKHGFSRYLELYNRVDISKKPLFVSFIDINRSLFHQHPKVMHEISKSLAVQVYKHLDQENFIKIKKIMAAAPRYDIYLEFYQYLTEQGEIEDDQQADKYRMQILDEILQKMPELGYTNLAEWLDEQLDEGAVALKTLQKKFAIDQSTLIDILKTLTEKGLINAVLIEDTIQRPYFEEAIRFQPDLTILKQWKVISGEGDKQSAIELFVRITNIGDVEIQNVQVVLDYPSRFFTVVDEQKGISRQLTAIGPEGTQIESWKFFINRQETKKVEMSGVKLVLIYQKEGKISSVIKKLDLVFFG